MEEEDIQEAAGGGGGLQRQGEEQARLSAVHLAGIGERLHPRESRLDGGLWRLHSRVSYWEAGAPAECGFLRVMVESGVDGWVRGCSASIVSGRPYGL